MNLFEKGLGSFISMEPGPVGYIQSCYSNSLLSKGLLRLIFSSNMNGFLHNSISSFLAMKTILPHGIACGLILHHLTFGRHILILQ